MADPLGSLYLPADKTVTSDITDSAMGVKYRGVGNSLIPDGLYEIYVVEGTRTEGFSVLDCDNTSGFISLSASGAVIVQPLVIPDGGQKVKVVGFMAIEARLTVRGAAYQGCQTDDPFDIIGSFSGQKVSDFDGLTLSGDGWILKTIGGVYRQILGDWTCGDFSITRRYNFSMNLTHQKGSKEYVEFRASSGDSTGS